MGICDEKNDAQSLFEKGTQQFEDKQYEDAAESFFKAYNLQPTWKLLFNIGQSLAADKQYGRALEIFEKYLAQAGDDVSVERMDWVRSEMTRLRDVVGSVKIVTPDECKNDGCIVKIDGRERGVTPLPGMLKIGFGIEHVITLEKNEKTVLNEKILVSAGDTIIVQQKNNTSILGPPEPALSEKTATDSTPSPDARLTKAGWITTGIGAAILIGGGVAGIIAFSKNSALKDSKECNSTACGESEYSTLDARDTAATISTVLMSTGGAVAIAGVLMIILGEKKRNEKITVQPVIQNHLTGAMITGRF
ncbi:MAG: tetratricopeptide repeat protein [Deltaproteobacteria bacterium]|nr:tetratricopeptide repeat protein [Deltaproteobacteria bacterium]